MTLKHLKTPAAASALGVSYTQLMSLLRYGKIPPPGKDSSGHYVWSAEDLEAVRRSLCRETTSKKNTHEKE